MDRPTHLQPVIVRCCRLRKYGSLIPARMALIPIIKKNNAESPAKIRKAWMNTLIVMSQSCCFWPYNI